MHVVYTMLLFCAAPPFSRLAPRGDLACRQNSYLECVAEKKKYTQAAGHPAPRNMPTLAGEDDETDPLVNSITETHLHLNMFSKLF